MEERSSDPQVWMQWLEEISGENDQEEDQDLSDAETVADDDENDEQEIQHSSDEEQIDCNTAPDFEDDSFFLGKNKITKWYKTPPRPNVKLRSRNIITRLPGTKGIGKNAKTEIDCLNLMIDDRIIKRIVMCTNIYIESIKSQFSRERDARFTNDVEMRAFIGLLYFIGTMKSSRLNTSKIWHNEKGNGMERCYLSMSENRFHFLLRCIRYDNRNTRQQRSVQDKLAPIRELLDLFLENFQNYYTPGEYLTVDEQLVAFRGRCPFKQFIPSKPARYGIKVFVLVDCRMMYTVNLEVYCGKQPKGPFDLSNAGKDVVMRISKPILGTGRNITGDNWFSSVPLVQALLEKKTTYVGTLRQNKIEIPYEFLPQKKRDLNSSVFGFSSDMSLVSYCERNAKAVILLSSMHSDNAIDKSSGFKNKPEIVTFYNQTKVGVDVLDQLCSNYDTARTTKRWPTVFFLTF